MVSLIRYCFMGFCHSSFKEDESYTTHLITPYFLNFGLLVYFIELIRRNQGKRCDGSKGILSDIGFHFEFCFLIVQCVILLVLILMYVIGCGWWNKKIEIEKYRVILIILTFGLLDLVFLSIYFPYTIYYIQCPSLHYIIFRAFLVKIIVNTVQNLISLVVLPCFKGREIRRYSELVADFFA